MKQPTREEIEVFARNVGTVMGKEVGEATLNIILEYGLEKYAQMMNECINRNTKLKGDKSKYYFRIPAEA